MIGAAAGTASNYTESLVDVTQKLGVATDEPAVRAIVESLVQATKEMEKNNQALEERLSASKQEITALQENLDAVRNESLTDPLTSLSNRKYFDDTLAKAIADARARGEALSLMMTDVDHFKKFNDSYGHLTGDQVLRLVAISVKQNVKGEDIAARYGGEEFAVLLPHTEVDDAHRLAQRMCEVVRQLAIPHRQSEVAPHVTISAGVASALLVLARDLPVEAERASPTLLIKAADQALYGAKAAGRNQVMSARAGDGSRRTDERQPAGDELPPDATPTWGDAVRVL
jgi:diguanylate cyclase